MIKKLTAGLLLLGTVSVTSLVKVNPANALTLKSTAATNNSSGSVDVDVDTTIEDILGGVKVSLDVNDATNTGDLRAAFFDFSDSSISNLSVISISPTNGNNLGFQANTNGSGGPLLGGNIGQRFDLGIALSSPGSSGGALTSIMFNIFGQNLDAADFIGQTFAVRLQSAGIIEDPMDRSGSSKQFGEFNGETVPTPAAVLPALLGMGTAAIRKRKNASEANQEA